MTNKKKSTKSSIEQEMNVTLKRNTEKILSIYLTRFPITGQSR